MSNDLCESIEYKGFTIRVRYDTFPGNPRTERDNACRMVCFHRRYNLGDQNLDYREDDYSSWNELEQAIRKAEAPVEIFTLWLYDHSGLAISCTRTFGDIDPGHWDSGQVGFVYVPRKTALYEMSAKRVTQKIKTWAARIIMAEVETYNDYLSGEVYGYTIEDPGGNELDDSCWGFYGYDAEKEMVEECKRIIDHRLEKEMA